MAAGNYHSWARMAETVEMRGYFVGNGTNNPATIVGRGVTAVVRNSEGNYTLTLDQGYYRLLSWAFGVLALDAAAGNQKVVNLISSDMSAKTVVVQVIKAAATPEIEDLTSAERLSFNLTFQRTAST